MNSHNKPEKKAIHANNQPMEVAFHSAPGLSTSLQAVGFEMDVAQLSRGRLEGSFRLGGSRQLPVLSIQPIKICCFRATDALGCCPSA